VLVATRPVVLRIQLVRFAVVGLTSTGLDALIYRLSAFALPIPAAKAIGFLAGMTFSIACNRGWSFAQDGARSSLIGCLAVYLVALAINVSVNDIVLVIARSPSLAFCTATAASAVCTFAGLRRLASLSRSTIRASAPAGGGAR